MKLVSFGPRGSELPGVLINDSVLPLPPVMASLGIAPTGTIRSVLPFLGPLREAVGTAAARGDQLIPLDQTRLGPPITDPPNLFACGANYFAHLSEPGLDMPGTPTLPVMFLKPRSALSGPADPVIRPAETTQLDYEAELAIVIGRKIRNVSPTQAARYIFGYTASQDISDRTIQRAESQWARAPTLLWKAAASPC